MAAGWGPPEFAGAGGVTAFTEGAAVAPFALVTIMDPDNNVIAVSVAITGGFHAGEDVLALSATAGIGNITASFDADIGLLTLTSADGSATPAEWQTALSAVTYDNTAEDPTAGARTLTLGSSDGGGGTALPVSQTVTVAAVNDAPAGSSSSVSTPHGVARVLSGTDFGFSDVDGDVLAAVRIVGLPTSGALTLGGVAVMAGQSVSAAQLAGGQLVFTPAGAGAVSFTFQVQDDGGTASGGADLDPSANTLTISVGAAPGLRPVPSLGGTGADTAVLDDNPTTYAAGDGADLVAADGGNDTVHGNFGADTIYGGWGDDVVRGGQGSDILFGDDGTDLQFGDLGDDLIHGGRGDDTLEGGEGSDALQGGQGNDVLRGGAGVDVLSGDKGDDTLIGGAGDDLFRFFGGGGADVIVDFDAGDGDRLQVFGGYTLRQAGADLVVELEGGAVTLQGVQLSTLPTGWIIV